MTDEEFERLYNAAGDVFTALYAIYAGSLTYNEKLEHQREISVAYKAVLALENSRFEDLSEEVKDSLRPLVGQTVQLQHQLMGLKEPAEVLRIVASAIDLLKAIIRLLA